jgi:hypothetical protein
VPTNAGLTAGSVSGSVVLRTQKSANADNYTVQKATSPEGPFTDYGLSSSTRTELTGFTPGTTIYVRARANGAAGASDWSNVASRMVIEESSAGRETDGAIRVVTDIDLPVRLDSQKHS